MFNKGVTHSQVGQFYDSSVITRFWSGLKQKHMHVGFWDDAHPFQNDLFAGAVRFTETMISLTGIRAGERFVDIGCGYGVPAVLLAQKKKCRVSGVTVSTHQQEFAERNARETLPDGQAEFRVADAVQLPFPNDTFDGGWFFESIFHIGHEPALREAQRVLKAGAELLIADFVRTGDVSPEETAFLAQNLGIKSAVALADYPALLEKTGFRMIEARDITANTLAAEKHWGVHLDIIERREGEIFASLDEPSYLFLKNFFLKLHDIGQKAIGYGVIRAVK